MLRLVNVTGLVIVIGGLLGLILNRDRLLNILLRLEFISLGIFFLIVVVLRRLRRNLFCRLYLLALLVCEGVLGLALLVVGRFRYGGGQAQLYNRLVC